jgi:DNA-binding NarL/FixJ family response regulator
MTQSLPHRPLRILLLDDDTFMLDLLGDMFADLGDFELLAESGAKAALLTLHQRHPDLLVCDLSMPDMDGIEFLQEAAAAGYKGQVMLLSGMDVGVRRAAERLARAHGLNVIGAYKKPLSQETLAEALHLLGPGISANPA